MPQLFSVINIFYATIRVMKTIVVAYDKNRGIGAANDLLWHRDLPSDLAHFKELTMGGAMIMGSKTYDSIGRPLPRRQSIVLSREAKVIEGVTVVNNLRAAYDAVEPSRETFVIGGGQIYALAIDSVDRLEVTEVDASFENADTFFPEIDNAKWREVNRVHHDKDERNLYSYDFVTYDRR
jgi:dihydrofolate reductase